MTRIANLLSVVLITCFCKNAHAQNPIKEIGNIKSIVINNQSVDITTDNAFAKITVYSPDIIRVRIDKQKLKPDFSYAVIAQPLKTTVAITQNDTAIFITTDSIKTIIHKNTFFYWVLHARRR